MNLKVLTAPMTIPGTPATVAIVSIPNGYTSSPSFNVAHDGNAESFEAKILRASDDFLIKDWTPFPQGGQVSGLTLSPGVSYYAIVRGVNRLGSSGEITTDVWLPNTNGCLGDMMTNSPFAGGTGEKNDPYLICTNAQFLAISTSASYLTKSFSLLADVDLSGETFAGFGSDTTPFKGRFFGNNKSVTNFSVNDIARDGIGLFNALSNAMIMDLSLDNFSITGHDKIGTLAGNCTTSFIKNIRAQNLILNAREIVGGVIGVGMDCLAIDLVTSGSIQSSSLTGGLIGFSFGTSILNAVSEVTIAIASGGNNGGAIGLNSTSLKHMFSYYQNIRVKADVAGDFSTGGIIGTIFDDMKLYRSSFEGSITGDFMAGGAIGQSDAGGGRCEIKSVNTKYTLEGNGTLGGFVGSVKDQCIISDVKTDGFIKLADNSSNAGGLTASMYMTGSFSNSLAIVDIVASGDYVGGAAGAIYNGSIINSAVIGDVSGRSGSYTSLFSAYMDWSLPLNTSSYYWSGSDCTLVNPGTCKTSDGTPLADRNSFYDPTIAPFSFWDFTNVWQANAGTFPSLRESQSHSPSVSHNCTPNAIVGLPYKCELNIVDADVNETQFISLEQSHECDWLMPRAREFAGTADASNVGSCEVKFKVTDGTHSSAIQSMNVSVHDEISLPYYMDSYSFNDQAVSAGPNNSSITITNNTASPMSFTISGLTGGPFAMIGSSCGSTLPASGSCNLDLTFDPTIAGTFRDSLFINYVSGATPVSIEYRLMGTGI